MPVVAPPKILTLEPQPGPQLAASLSQAHIIGLGGAGGGGKSWEAVFEAGRGWDVPDYSALLLRRTAKEIMAARGLWWQSHRVYPNLRGVKCPNGPKPRENPIDWRWDLGKGLAHGSRIVFEGMECEVDRLKYQGHSYDFIGWDQLEHFTSTQFWYMESRVRGDIPLPFHRRQIATFNPAPDSFIATELLMPQSAAKGAEPDDFWIDDEGFPRMERSGQLRYYVRYDDEMNWSESAEELEAAFDPRDHAVRSFTFIPALLDHNKILEKADPDYRRRLMSMTRVDRMQLLYGNWKIRASAGELFKREWWRACRAVPATGIVCRVRAWDRAATEKRPDNDPAWTRGVRMAMHEDGRVFVEGVVSMREPPGTVTQAIRNTAEQDGEGVIVCLYQDPASAGKYEIEATTRALHGFDFFVERAGKEGDKVAYAKPYSAQVEAGNVFLVEGEWNEDFMAEHERFPGTSKTKKDQVDAASLAYLRLTSGEVAWSIS